MLQIQQQKYTISHSILNYEICLKFQTTRFAPCAVKTPLQKPAVPAETVSAVNSATSNGTVILNVFPTADKISTQSSMKLPHPFQTCLKKHNQLRHQRCAQFAVVTRHHNIVSSAMLIFVMRAAKRCIYIQSGKTTHYNLCQGVVSVAHQREVVYGYLRWKNRREKIRLDNRIINSRLLEDRITSIISRFL